MKIVLTGIICLLALCSAVEVQAADIQIKGSDTIIKLTQRLAEEYCRLHPDVHISISGGGSGNGIAAIINNAVSIVDASREMKPAEIERAAARHVIPTRVVLAVDAIAIVVNEANPVRQLTVGQIGAIFRGEIRNWKSLGGEDLAITLYGRQSSSGTFVYFREHVLKGEYASLISAFPGNVEILEAVKADRSGIGYAGVGFAGKASGVKALDVLVRPATTVSPLNKEDVLRGRYPISRPLNQYINGTPAGDIHDFVAFELGPQGQKIVEEEGFYPLTEDLKKENRKVGF